MHGLVPVAGTLLAVAAIAFARRQRVLQGAPRLRSASRSKRREVGRAIRAGRAVSDPRDAELALETIAVLRRQLDREPSLVARLGAGYVRFELAMLVLLTVAAAAIDPHVFRNPSLWVAIGAAGFGAVLPLLVRRARVQMRGRLDAAARANAELAGIVAGTVREPDPPAAPASKPLLTPNRAALACFALVLAVGVVQTLTTR